MRTIDRRQQHAVQLPSVSKGAVDVVLIDRIAVSIDGIGDTISALQLHPHAIIVADEAACGELKVDTYKYFKDIEKENLL